MAFSKSAIGFSKNVTPPVLPISGALLLPACVAVRRREGGMAAARQAIRVGQVDG
jgi:hypothetical protein